MVITTVSKDKINSKPLFNSIDLELTDIFVIAMEETEDDSIPNVLSVLRMYTNDILEHYLTFNKIEKYFVRAKYINNVFNIEIEYQQRHCFNTTRIVYEIS